MEFTGVVLAPEADTAGSGKHQEARPPQPPKRRNAPPGRVRRVIREVGSGLIAAGVVVVLFMAYQLFGTNLAEAKSQRELKKAFQAPAEPAPNPVSNVAATTVLPLPPAGEAVAHIVIPKIGVDKFVVEGVHVTQLRKGPGHYPGTPLPGQPGNAAIAGHRTTYGAPFYRLNELQPGDDILVTTMEGHFRYVVSQSAVVKPSQWSVLDSTPDNRLTLTTCNPRFSAATRLVVVSRLTDLPAPPPTPAAPNQVSRPRPALALDLGHGQQGAWPPTITYGLLVLLLWAGLRVWAARRRRTPYGARLPRHGLRRSAMQRLLPYLVGIPVCLVPLWFFFENVIRLLPANI
ncbi:MAG TPA: class E sortase [Acidimicrobiales bacterium]